MSQLSKKLSVPALIKLVGNHQGMAFASSLHRRRSVSPWLRLFPDCFYELKLNYLKTLLNEDGDDSEAAAPADGGPISPGVVVLAPLLLNLKQAARTRPGRTLLETHGVTHL
jgi:hypothetical protein